jgi:hypothetical protein
MVTLISLPSSLSPLIQAMNRQRYSIIAVGPLEMDIDGPAMNVSSVVVDVNITLILLRRSSLLL